MTKKGNRPAPIRTSPKMIKGKERAAQALELRKAGLSLQVIADQMGYSDPSGAHKAIKRAMDRMVREPATELIEMELARLDSIFTEVYRAARQGSLGAIDRCLRIMERRARLLGIDAPQKIAPTDPTGEHEFSGFTDSEVVREFATIVTEAETAEVTRTGNGTEVSVDAKSKT